MAPYFFLQFQNDYYDTMGSNDYNFVNPREIRKKLPLTRLKRLEGEKEPAGRVSRDSLPVIRLRKKDGHLERVIIFFLFFFL